MSASGKTIVQYLNEAHAMETGLVRVLQEQIALAPHGSYRSALEEHLAMTRGHAARIAARRRRLRGGTRSLAPIVSAAQDAVAQALALAKSPFDLIRGDSAEEKVLKNAKDACASEALEIATYIALEQLASSAGDVPTAELAASIRSDEEAMLARVQRELPALAAAVACLEPPPPAAAAAAADTAAAVAGTAHTRATPATAAAVAGTVHARATPASRSGSQRAAGSRHDEPWPGYDELTAEKIVRRLRSADSELAAGVRVYERAHKNRTTVLRAAERERVPA